MTIRAMRCQSPCSVYTPIVKLPERLQTAKNLGGVASKKYALSERTFSTVRRIWESSIGVAKEGEELEWEKLIYRTAFPDDTTDIPIPDDLDVPEDELLSDR